MERANHLPTLAMVAFAALLGCGLAVQAQDQEDPSADEECVVPPDNSQANGESGLDRSSENRAERLADCGGVLKPPPTGDPEFVEPAPDEGKTPVIPPRALPETPENEGGEDE
ncbi:hypothetical protein [Mesorhizobium sp. J18]|uniref:hypothetical protein n=1 Tax=Mesorhizobium sp. J18 TaxID=935263 RepID=UPI0011A330AC|nr:hypothetical protein [Mesorhizobium sp. J18]